VECRRLLQSQPNGSCSFENLPLPFVFLSSFQFHSNEQLNRLILQAIECCEPFRVNLEEDQFVGANETVVTSTCGDPSCAQSYVDALAQFFERSNDPILGCSSGYQVFFAI
jgi:hypothetical protein